MTGKIEESFETPYTKNSHKIGGRQPVGLGYVHEIVNYYFFYRAKVLNTMPVLLVTLVMLLEKIQYMNP